MIQSVKILPGEHPGLYDIYIGDQRLDGVTGVDVRMRVDEQPQVELKVIASDVTIALSESDIKLEENNGS